jgi:glycosyltransferase involved in cell wall biosynthesis
MTKIGIIARADKTGLGYQTKELVDMLKPHKILLIDSSHFNGNQQFPEWYKEYNVQVTQNGFASYPEVGEFLTDVDVVISCEIFYSTRFSNLAYRRGIKTILQYNYEFFEYFIINGMRQPNILLGPTTWNIDFMKQYFGGKSDVVHLPPPTTPSIFESAKETNLAKTHKRILHVAGKRAAKDRNGTDIVIEMLKYSKADYELVVTVQGDFKPDCDDPRLVIDNSNPDDRAKLYTGFDFMILPRRYGGLCLPMNEALLSGLPVIMTDVSPNNDILLSEWLVEATKVGEVQFKGLVDLFDTDPRKLAELVDKFINDYDIANEKQKAFNLGYNTFSPDVLKDKYLSLIG